MPASRGLANQRVYEAASFVQHTTVPRLTVECNQCTYSGGTDRAEASFALPAFPALASHCAYL